MRVGFVHGVMNTDNMSILGLTIDYGPYGWLEGFDPDWTPNTTDAAGRRYCYGNQPQIAQWNLSRLAGALLPLVADAPRWSRGSRLIATSSGASTRPCSPPSSASTAWSGTDDAELFDELFAVLGAAEIDMTIFFRGLARVPLEGPAATAQRLEPLRARSTTRTPRPASAGTMLAWLCRCDARRASRGAAPTAAASTRSRAS